MCDTKSALEKAIRIANGQSALARLIGKKVRQGHVYYWLKVGRVPAGYVLAIERATGGQVTRHELRPDLYPLDEQSQGREAA